MGLDLLGAPALVGLAHVGGGLDGGDELEGDVGDADEADDGAGDDAEDGQAEQDGADEDVEGAAPREREQERAVPRRLRRHLELQQHHAQPKQDHVDSDDQRLAASPQTRDCVSFFYFCFSFLPLTVFPFEGGLPWCAVVALNPGGGGFMRNSQAEGRDELRYAAQNHDDAHGEVNESAARRVRFSVSGAL